MAIKSIASVKSHFETGDRPTQTEFENLIDTLGRNTPIAIASAAEGGKTGLFEILGDADVTARNLGVAGRGVIAADSTASSRLALGIVSAASEALIQGTIGSAMSSWGANDITVQLVEAASTSSAQDALGISAVGQAVIVASTTASATSALHVLRAETAQATTSGTEFDFTGIPSWARKITVMFSGVSLGGTNSVLVQIGDAGGLETSGYTSTSNNLNQASSSGGASSTSGFVARLGNATDTLSGNMVLALVDPANNTWTSSHSMHRSSGTICVGGGDKSLSDTLTQLRVTRTGSNTFDAGVVNILIE